MPTLEVRQVLCDGGNPTSYKRGSLAPQISRIASGRPPARRERGVRARAWVEAASAPEQPRRMHLRSTFPARIAQASVGPAAPVFLGTTAGKASLVRSTRPAREPLERQLR